MSTKHLMLSLSKHEAHPDAGGYAPPRIFFTSSSDGR
jgi:hypothetical protein